MKSKYRVRPKTIYNLLEMIGKHQPQTVIGVIIEWLGIKKFLSDGIMELTVRMIDPTFYFQKKNQKEIIGQKNFIIVKLMMSCDQEFQVGSVGDLLVLKKVLSIVNMKKELLVNSNISTKWFMVGYDGLADQSFKVYY